MSQIPVIQRTGDEVEYRRTMSVNGQYEFEGSWSLLKILLSLPFLALVFLESAIITLVVMVYARFFCRDEVYRKDRRLWPVSPLFYMASTGARFAKRNSMKWQAIEFIYNWDRNTSDLNFYDAMLTKFWGSFENVVATRNRFRNLKRELFWEIQSRISHGKDSVSIVSLAAGSARGPIEVLAYFLKRNELSLEKVTINLVDNDPAAYEFAQNLADEIYPGLSKRIKFWQSTISAKPEGLEKLRQYLQETNPDIREMVGFGDYLSYDKAVKVIGVIHETMSEGSLFITNNVAPNRERVFLEWVVSWAMVNRTEKQVHKFLNAAGFASVRTVWEPTAIQTVYSCRK